jgi:hypothetical protein
MRVERVERAEKLREAGLPVARAFEFWLRQLRSTVGEKEGQVGVGVG